MTKNEAAKRPQPHNQPALILAAHGSRRELRANAIVQEHAQRLRDLHGFAEVHAAFWQGTPHLSQVLEQVVAPQATVVPFFSADGYYSQTVLPRELARNSGYSARRLRLTSPLGVQPEVRDLALARVRDLLQWSGWQPDQTAVAVVGHGTGRHPSSRRSALELTHALRRLRSTADCVCAFLDEEPFVEELFKHGLPQPQVLLLPFLIGGSFHALRDIPQRVGLELDGDAELPLTGRAQGKRVICDRAIGSDPGIATIIAQLAEKEGFNAQTDSMSGEDKKR